jgi:hypothetical protein
MTKYVILDLCSPIPSYKGEPVSDRFDLKDVIAIGRTLDEYSRMFDLRFTQLKGAAILDMGGGVSSFTAEANELGLNVKSCDRIYGLPVEALEEKCAADLKEMLGKLPAVRDNYRWDFYKNEESLGKYREKAYKTFINDYARGDKTRYVKSELPFTVFTDKEFDITLVSHFLFLYDEHRDYNFHMDSIAELIRITKEEIRIFPVVNLRWKKSEFVDKIMNEAVFGKCVFELKKVDFEFVKGGNEYLSIKMA